MSDKQHLGWLDQIKWDDKGLVPVITQDVENNQVLMMAWMNREALVQTVEQKLATYWSRSKQRLWTKGEVSGHTQQVHDIYLDCDNDAIVLVVSQKNGIACHTGRYSCFYRKLENDAWKEILPVIKTPGEIYKK